MSTSTLARWKQLHPEIGPKLKQARQEIRAFHLQRVFEQAAAENGKGWRASVWILERLFPGDYSPRMKDRLEYLELENRVHDREVHEALDEQLRELHAMQAEERAAREAPAAAPVIATGPWPVPPGASEVQRVEPKSVADDGAPAIGARETHFPSEGASHDSRNSEAAWPVEVAADTPRSQQAAASTKRQQAATVQGGCATGESDRTYVDASHNSRNSGPERPVEVAADTPHSQQAAASTKRQQAAAVQGGCATGESDRTYVDASHNSRNSGAAGPVEAHAVSPIGAKERGYSGCLGDAQHPRIRDDLHSYSQGDDATIGNPGVPPGRIPSTSQPAKPVEESHEHRLQPTGI